MFFSRQLQYVDQLLSQPMARLAINLNIALAQQYHAQQTHSCHLEPFVGLPLIYVMFLIIAQDHKTALLI